MIKFGCSSYKILKYLYKSTGNIFTKRNVNCKIATVPVNKIKEKYNFNSFDSVIDYLQEEIRKGYIDISDNEIFLTELGENFVLKEYSKSNQRWIDRLWGFFFGSFFGILCTIIAEILRLNFQ